MLVVVVLCSILVESLSLSLLFEPVMLHGDRSVMIITAGLHLQPPESFNFQTPDEWPCWRKCSNNLESHRGSEQNLKNNRLTLIVLLRRRV